MKIDNYDGNKVAIYEVDDVQLTSIDDALDLMATTKYHDCDQFIVYKESLSDDFFDLKTRFAGEVLQKYMNYHMRIAIIGDFSVYKSKSLRDFIYECNKGSHIYFMPCMESAINALM